MIFDMPPAIPAITIYASDCKKGDRDCFPTDRVPAILDIARVCRSSHPCSLVAANSEEDDSGRGSGRLG